MKILVIQLARLGDIVQSWPTIEGLRLAYPSAEIHVLSRSAFSSIWNLGPKVDKIHSISFSETLAPIVVDKDVNQAILNLKSEFQVLKQIQFDEIINISFSPVSADITHYLKTESTVVRGYDRFSDGTLKIADEASRYFYAQVGTEKANRIHLIDLFGQVAGVDPAFSTAPRSLDRNLLAVHIGASTDLKNLSADEWVYLINQIKRQNPETNVTLLGAKSEEGLANHITRTLRFWNIQNQVGQTSLAEAYNIIKNAGHFIGPDSSLLQLASIADVPSINISKASVNFWETGPKASTSYVIRWDDFENKEQASDAVLSCLQGQALGRYTYVYDIKSNTYLGPQGPSSEAWNMIKHIYLGSENALSAHQREALLSVLEVNQLAVEVLEQWLVDGQQPELANAILEQVPELFESISHNVSSVSPLIEWFSAELTQIAPGNPLDILNSTLETHLRLHHLVMNTLGKSLDLMQQPAARGLDGEV